MPSTHAAHRPRRDAGNRYFCAALLLSVWHIAAAQDVLYDSGPQAFISYEFDYALAVAGDQPLMQLIPSLTTESAMQAANWSLKNVTNNVWQFVNDATGQCLAVERRGTLTVDHCNAQQTSQQFELVAGGGATQFKIRARSTGECLYSDAPKVTPRVCNLRPEISLLWTAIPTLTTQAKARVSPPPR